MLPVVVRFFHKLHSNGADLCTYNIYKKLELVRFSHKLHNTGV